MLYEKDSKQVVIIHNIDVIIMISSEKDRCLACKQCNEEGSSRDYEGDLTVVTLFLRCRYVLWSYLFLHLYLNLSLLCKLFVSLLSLSLPPFYPCPFHSDNSLFTLYLSLLYRLLSLSLVIEESYKYQHTRYFSPYCNQST